MKNRQWPLALCGLLAVSLVAVGGCGSSPNSGNSSGGSTKAQNGGTIRTSFTSNIETLDPAQWTDTTSMNPMQEIYDTLVEYNTSNSGLHPALASRYTVSKDGLTYTFYLRKGVKFSNGDPLTAADVIYSLNRVTRGDATSSGPAPYGFAYSDIVGYNQWYNGGKTPPTGMTGLSGLTSPKAGVVQIKLQQPEAYFLNVLALMSADIVDPPVVQKYGQNYELHAVGTGPMELKSWNQGHQMILVANPKSWRPQPHVKQVIFDENVSADLALLRFQSGEYQLVEGPLPSEVYAKILASASLKKLYNNVPENGMVYLAMNTTKAPFNNVYLRQAVNYALNKSLIIKDITNGRATELTQPLPPGIPGYNPTIKNPYPYNVAKAKALVKQSGYNGQMLTFIYPSTTTDRIRTAEIVQEELQAIGLNVKLQGISQIGNYWPTEDTASGNWNIAWTDWFQDYPDAQDFLENLLGTQAFGATNVGEWTNPQFQKLIDEADALPASQQATRVKDFQQAETIATNNACWAFLYNEWNDDLVTSALQPTPGSSQSNLMLYLHPVLQPQYSLLWIKGSK